MDSAAQCLYWDDVQSGTPIPAISLDVTYKKVAMVPMATWDMYPGHHNHHFAEQQGQKSIYLNTMALQGFADRLLTDWAGPATFIERRKIAMKKSVFPGDTLVATGHVDKTYVDQGRHKIDVSIQLKTESGIVVEVSTTAVLPARNS